MGNVFTGKIDELEWLPVNVLCLIIEGEAKEEAQGPELYSLGKNCVLICVSSLTQVRLKLGYLTWVLCGFCCVMRSL